MPLLKPRQPLFSQALSYGRINNKLKEKWIITQDFASTERCYAWKGDAEATTNTKKESPILPVPEQLQSIGFTRTFSWETQPRPAAALSLLVSCCHRVVRTDSAAGRRASRLFTISTSGFILRSVEYEYTWRDAEMQSTAWLQTDC